MEDEREIIERSSVVVEAVAWGLVGAIAMAGVEAAIKGEEGVGSALAAAIIAAGVISTQRRAAASVARASSVMVESVADANDSSWAANAFASVGKQYGGWRDNASMGAVVREVTRQTAQAQAAVGTSDLLVRHWGGDLMPVGSWLRSVMDDAAQATSDGVPIADSTLKAVRAVMRQGGVSIRSGGRNHDISGFVRQQAWDGSHKALQDLRYQVGKDVGWTAVQVSAHAFCAPDHVDYQGKVYSALEFQYIQDHLERPLGMWNCRHLMTPCPDDASSVWSADERAMLRRESEREVTLTGLDGKERTMSRYEASQWQRGMERGIRGTQVESQAARKLGDRDMAAKRGERADYLTGALESGCAEAGLRFDPNRVKVGRLR